MARRSFALLVLVACTSILFAVGIPFSAPQNSLAPYVPTPQPVVDKMLELAQVTSKDVLYDLGCGDGIILDDQESRELLAENGDYLGVDVSSELLEKARGRHHEKNVSFLQGNLSDNDLVQKIISRNNMWDCIISVFVIQEIPDIESFVINLKQLLDFVSVAIIVTVISSP